MHDEAFVSCCHPKGQQKQCSCSHVQAHTKKDSRRQLQVPVASMHVPFLCFALPGRQAACRAGRQGDTAATLRCAAPPCGDQASAKPAATQIRCLPFAFEGLLSVARGLACATQTCFPPHDSRGIPRSRPTCAEQQHDERRGPHIHDLLIVDASEPTQII